MSRCIHALLSPFVKETCPRNTSGLPNSVHNEFHKHNMEATASHMQTHGNVEVGRGQSFETLGKPLPVEISSLGFIGDKQERCGTRCYTT